MAELTAEDRKLFAALLEASEKDFNERWWPNTGSKLFTEDQKYAAYRGFVSGYGAGWIDLNNEMFERQLTK